MPHGPQPVQPTLSPMHDPRTLGLTCQGCGAAEAMTSWDVFPGGERCVRLTCARCNRFLRNLTMEPGVLPVRAGAGRHQQRGPGPARGRLAVDRVDPALRWHLACRGADADAGGLLGLAPDLPRRRRPPLLSV
jgi:hypothetical protein